jgi:DNA mismatch repair protein MutS
VTPPRARPCYTRPSILHRRSGPRERTRAAHDRVLATGDLDQLSLLGGEFLPTTPIRRQYLEHKARHPDAILFFRLGDFYETFDEDARVVSRALEIALTSREMGRGERVPMAGVPAQAAEGYIARLIERGHRVALCDQIGEAPIRGLVPRQVVRVVTPGTLVEDGLLPSRSNNFLAALLVERGAAGLAYVDVSTGHLAATEVRGATWRPLLAAELVRLGPAECLVPADAEGESEPLADLLPPGARPTPRAAVGFGSHRTAERLGRQFDAATVASLGLEERPLAARATAGLLEYVEETLPAALRLLDRIEIYSVEGSMVLDSATRRSLELTEGLRTGGRAGSLLEVVDDTRTAMGARLLRQWVSCPLLDLARIATRQDAVAELVDAGAIRAGLADRLASLPDLERLASRAAQRLLSPREALALAGGVRPLPEVRAQLSRAAASLLADLSDDLHDFTSLADRIEQTVASPPPASLGDGVVRPGCSAELDELRDLAGNTRAWIANLERGERQRTGVRGLRVGYNRVFGYYLEVSKAGLGQPTDYYQRERTGAATIAAHLDQLGYLRRQTLAGAERFVTAELQEYELRVRNAQEEIARLERRLFGELLDIVASEAGRLLESARAIARLDALLSFASVAVRGGYSRPELVDGELLEIAGGRHPVVERHLEAGAFVPNDTRLGGEHPTVAILTGPNMAGKSTYLRQVALLVLLAQVGSFVPADSARLGLVDRIFARVGAQDDLAAQRSTFMVEMIETANILRNASPRSLLVLDEIGRGTSTYDGIAVARAIVEHIHDSPRLGCKTLFATHYHELADLERALPRVIALRMDVLERGDRVVFLHRVAPGAADRSYGVYVARLAGVPDVVTRRAATILANLELRNGGPRPIHPAPEPVPRGAPDPGQEAVLRRLVDLDPLRMTPLEALAELSALRELLTRDA